MYSKIKLTILILFVLFCIITFLSMRFAETKFNFGLISKICIAIMLIFMIEECITLIIQRKKKRK